LRTHHHARATAATDASYHLALEHIRRNHFRKATQALAEALRSSPDNPYYLSAYGLCLAREGRNFEPAVRLCRLAVNMLPYDTELRVNLGRVYRLKGDNASAYALIHGAWEIDQQHSGATMELKRMGIRRQPVIPFLSRSCFPNPWLGKIRARVERITAQVLVRWAGHGEEISDLAAPSPAER
jgi:tetratricopeptide (TPR) repeat protein